MTQHAGDWLNIVLGVCAIGYSFMPADRVRNYRRGLALFMRFIGLVLLLVSGSNLWLLWSR
jgi:hypothetical protein